MTLKKYLKVPKGEKYPDKAIRLTEVKAAEKSSLQPRSSRAPKGASPITSSAS
jgi:hypothetical protein